MITIIPLIAVSPQFYQEAHATTVPHYYEENTTCQNNTVDDVNIIEINDAGEFDFISGRQYLIMAQAQYNGDSVGDNVGMHVEIGGVEQADSEHVLEPNGAPPDACGTDAEMYSYLYFTVFTSDGTDTVSLHTNVGGGDEIHYDNISLFAMEISEQLTENTDWFYDTGGADTTLGTAWDTADDATETFTPSNNNDDWLVLGSAIIDPSNNGKNFDTRLNWSGGTDLNYNRCGAARQPSHGET